MKLSTRTRYGTRALLELALNRDKEPLLLKNIAIKQELSLPYLEQLVAPLIAGGIIRSAKGPKGGISLMKNPADIKLSDIVRLLEGSLAPVECVDDPGVCDRSVSCVTRDVWLRMKEAMDDVMRSTSLQDLIDRQKKSGTVMASAQNNRADDISIG
jgi:Rrf2 family transcriptional regulator, cysteine metabolism repressor